MRCLSVPTALALLLSASIAFAEAPPVGREVHLQGRAYQIDLMSIPSHTHWLGVPGQTIFTGVDMEHNPTDPKNRDPWRLNIIGDDVIIDGVTINGFTIKIDKPQGMNASITINNCEFHDGVIKFTSGLADSKITNCLFTGNTWAGFGIEGSNWNNLTVANNEFIDIGAGIHLHGFGGTKKLLFEQNYFSGIRGGMGAELMSDARIDNVLMQDNYYEKPNQGKMTHDELLNFMAMSFVFPTCTNVTTRRNIVIAPEKPDGLGVRIGIETAGIGYVCEDNYVLGCEWGITDADGTSPSNVKIRNNFMKDGTNPGIRQDHPEVGRLLTQTNNGPNVTLSPIMQNRIAKGTKPGRNRRLDDVPAAPAGR